MISFIGLLVKLLGPSLHFQLTENCSYATSKYGEATVLVQQFMRFQMWACWCYLKMESMEFALVTCPNCLLVFCKKRFVLSGGKCPALRITHILRMPKPSMVWHVGQTFHGAFCGWKTLCGTVQTSFEGANQMRLGTIKTLVLFKNKQGP